MSSKRVFSVLLGAGATALVMMNSRKVRQGLAIATVKGEEAAVAASRQIVRLSAEMAEDFQDDRAEARERQKAADQATPEALLSALRDLRQEVDALSSRDPVLPRKDFTVQ
jgi:hypothetical protein